LRPRAVIVEAYNKCACALSLISGAIVCFRLADTFLRIDLASSKFAKLYSLKARLKSDRSGAKLSGRRKRRAGARSNLLSRLVSGSPAPFECRVREFLVVITFCQLECEELCLLDTQMGKPGALESHSFSFQSAAI